MSDWIFVMFLKFLWTLWWDFCPSNAAFAGLRFLSLNSEVSVNGLRSRFWGKNESSNVFTVVAHLLVVSLPWATICCLSLSWLPSLSAVENLVGQCVTALKWDGVFWLQFLLTPHLRKYFRKAALPVLCFLADLSTERSYVIKDLKSKSVHENPFFLGYNASG